MKIDMANEVIDAGRFDMQTSMEERKQTLEAMLQVSTVLIVISAGLNYAGFGLLGILKLLGNAANVVMDMAPHSYIKLLSLCSG